MGLSSDQVESLTILALNPGSTSTKVAILSFDPQVPFGPSSPGDRALAPVTNAAGNLSVPEFRRGHEIWEEFPERLSAVRAWLKAEVTPRPRLSAVVGRGGLLRPLAGGTYRVSDRMLEDARNNHQGAHASNLGCALARALADDATRAQQAGAIGTGSVPPVPAFVVDPVSTDEFEDLARLSGLKEIPRKSLSHALSIHSVTREVCRERGLDLRGTRFVVAHLGGGISVCPVLAGRIIDANNANSGGPFSPTRAGGLPTQELLDLVYSGAFSERDLRRMTLKSGGLVSYLGTDDAQHVERLIAGGDEGARAVFEAMAYQISKEIGAMATVLNGTIDAIILTGGLSSSRILVGWIRQRVSFIAPVEVRSGVEEMAALAQGAVRVLTGEEELKEY